MNKNNYTVILPITLDLHKISYVMPSEFKKYKSKKWIQINVNDIYGKKLHETSTYPLPSHEK